MRPIHSIWVMAQQRQFQICETPISLGRHESPFEPNTSCELKQVSRSRPTAAFVEGEPSLPNPSLAIEDTNLSVFSH